jgi:hypothetical protein
MVRTDRSRRSGLQTMEADILSVAELGAAPDRGRIAGFARRQALAAAPAGALGR